MRKIHFFSFYAFLALLVAANTSYAQNTKDTSPNKGANTREQTGTVRLTEVRNPQHQIVVPVESIKTFSTEIASSAGILAVDAEGTYYLISDKGIVYRADYTIARLLSLGFFAH